MTDWVCIIASYSCLRIGRAKSVSWMSASGSHTPHVLCMRELCSMTIWRPVLHRFLTVGLRVDLCRMLTSTTHLRIKNFLTETFLVILLRKALIRLVDGKCYFLYHHH